MPKPEEVNPQNFTVVKVLYSDGYFSIAWGKWQGNSDVLAMRWDGDEHDMGYPKTFGHPVWFIIPENLSICFIKSIIGNENTRHKYLFEILEKSFSSTIPGGSHEMH